MELEVWLNPDLICRVDMDYIKIGIENYLRNQWDLLDGDFRVVIREQEADQEDR